ncbi:MAG: alpha/beta hydrolase [Candidatus Gottesmanbacteria bacterium]|nr:alpha/beta hydrolase [Candidatus Gottesmanbacteria bacterium]
MKSSIVILHGWGLSGKTFLPLEQCLKKQGYRVFAPDLPGFGATKIPEHPLALVDYAQFLDGYLKKNHIVQPILIGHSFGGRVSLKYNELYPNRVRALILSGTPGFTPIPKKKLLFFIALAKIGGFLFSIPPLSLAQDSVRRWYYYVVGAKEFFRAEGAMRETFKRIVREDLVSSMEAIKIPTLLLWGEYDIIVPLSIAERMHRVIVDSELLVIPEANHGVPYKQSEEFASYVTRFLGKL